jgi:acetate kinase
MRILVVNAGSSSVKLRLLDEAEVLTHSADLKAGSNGFDGDELAAVLESWLRPDVVCHRIVHGGTRFTRAVMIAAGVRAQLDELTDLAPLHQPKSLAALDAVSRLVPDAPAVACFDTAFHSTIPDAAATYAVPLEWRERYGVRRFGFHGLSNAYSTRWARETLGAPIASRRLVICHLGAGASVTAVVEGKSVDTTMGFTPLEGLVMATRSGTVDPGLVLWLEEHERLTPREVAVALEERSGLLALAGTADMREIESSALNGDPRARLAMAVYTHRLVTAIGSMTAAAGGIDALIFTGGVGEHSSAVRLSAVRRLEFMGLAIDESANERGAPDSDIAARGSAVRILIVAAREDLQMAREAIGLVGH